MIKASSKPKRRKAKPASVAFLRGGPRVKEVYSPGRTRSSKLPLYGEAIQAGFPSPADDYLEGKMDLNGRLVRHPAATFFVKVTGDSMLDAGIHPGDLLIVDRALEPQDNQVVIAVLDGQLTVKRIRRKGDSILLVPENQAYPPIPVKPEMNFDIWGVVTYAIHPV